MPKRRLMGLRTRRKRRIGKGFFDVLKSGHDWLKRNKIISTVSGALSKVGVPYAGAINTASSALGYGRRRKRVVRRRRGGAINLRGLLSSAHKFIKDKKLVSSALSHFGHNKLSAGAAALGYGRRRRVGRPVKRRTVRKRTVRRHRGGANYFSTEQIAMPKF